MNFANQYAFDRAATRELVTENLEQLVTATGRLDGLVAGPETVAGQNLKRAYQEVLAHNQPLVATDIWTLNQQVCAGTPGAGQLRTVTLSSDADGWVPPIPVAARAQRDLTAILTTQKSTTERAMEVLLYLSRWQLFPAGNQRTALVAANAVMLADGAGVLAIPADKLDWYQTQLRDYQRVGRGLVIKQWLYRNAVWGTPAGRVSEQPQQFHQNKYSPLNGPLD